MSFFTLFNAYKQSKEIKKLENEFILKIKERKNMGCITNANTNTAREKSIMTISINNFIENVTRDIKEGIDGARRLGIIIPEFTMDIECELKLGREETVDEYQRYIPDHLYNQLGTVKFVVKLDC